MSLFFSLPLPFPNEITINEFENCFIVVQERDDYALELALGDE